MEWKSGSRRISGARPATGSWETLSATSIIRVRSRVASIKTSARGSSDRAVFARVRSSRDVARSSRGVRGFLHDVLRAMKDLVETLLVGVVVAANVARAVDQHDLRTVRDVAVGHRGAVEARH